MIHFSSIFAYSLKDNITATWAMIKLKLRPKKYTDISPADLLARIEAGEDITVIDCRRPDIFTKIGHIRGAINCPIATFDESMHDLPKNTQLAVVCYFGFFCQIAAQKLAERGHKDVLSMTGGMEKWIMSDKPITKP